MGVFFWFPFAALMTCGDIVMAPDTPAGPGDLRGNIQPQNALCNPKIPAPDPQILPIPVPKFSLFQPPNPPLSSPKIFSLTSLPTQTSLTNSSQFLTGAEEPKIYFLGFSLHLSQLPPDPKICERDVCLRLPRITRIWGSAALPKL